MDQPDLAHQELIALLNDLVRQSLPLWNIGDDAASRLINFPRTRRT